MSSPQRNGGICAILIRPLCRRISRCKRNFQSRLYRSLVRVLAAGDWCESDVPRAVAHYQRLGFSISHHDEGYAFAHRDKLTIHLAGPGVDPERVGRGSIYMHVDDADHLADEWRKAGVEVIGPEDFDWGKREGRETDPDGNLIRFGSPLRR